MVGPGLCYRAVPISEVGLVFTLQIIHIDLNLVGNILEPLRPNLHRAENTIAVHKWRIERLGALQSIGHKLAYAF